MSVSRSRFIRLTSTTAVAAAAAATAAVSDEQSAAAAPSKSIGKASSFVAGKPVDFSYPDASSPAIAIKLSHPIDGGAGPNGDIIAYSRICVHKGCPVNYDASREVFVCPCHYSVYDPGKAGEVVIGHATTKLPRITLSHDAASDEIVATGVVGLLYGRFNNEPVS